MLLVFFARMVDDLVASVVATAAERGKSLLIRDVPEAPRPRVELVPLKPAANVSWVEGDWSWNGRHWSWEAGHWAEGNAKRALLSSVRHATTPANDVPASHRPNLMLLAASNR
jgi:hypothetical protein